MKLHAGTHNVEKSGNFEESKFSIEASSKAFFILSDGLYSNKILAVVRELSTNAYDSHVEANKADVPFDVHLPTPLKPVFFIRDYGTSMNHDNCMQLYTTYFRSTRNNSNDAVGCLGLGSKAPFAYSDSFTVEAYLDGTCRIYSGYKNQDGSPTFSMMEEVPTIEPNGIKVSINVNDYDVNRFHHEAHKVYEYFKVKPNFVSETLKYKSVNKVLAGDNWYFDDDANDNLVIMGQIAYPLDGNQLVSNDDPSNRYRNFIEYSDGLRIFLNIGDVDITPSRESLSYSKETKENILATINNIMNDISMKIEEEIKSQPNLYKARMKYVQISDQCSSIKSAIESLQKSICWNNIKLFDSVAGEHIEIKDKITCSLLSKGSYRKKIDTEYKVERFHFNGHNRFVIDDLTRGGISRLKQYMKDQDGSVSCYVYKLADGETIDSCRMYDIMGGATKSDVIITSSLPKVEYNRQGRGGYGDSGPAIQVQRFNEETGKFEVCNMSVKYENAHYFIESKDSVTFGNSTVTSHFVEQTLAYVYEKHNDAVDGMTFYLVKPSVIKNRKLADRNNWFYACNILETIFDDAVTKHKQNLIDTYYRHSLSNERNDRWVEVLKLTKIDSNAKVIVSEYQENNKKLDSIANEMHIIQTAAGKLPNVQRVDVSSVKFDKGFFAKRFDNEMKKYPMLKVINNVWNDADKKIVAEYIDGIESATKAENVLNSL
jgi:hypothetical protein